MVTDAKPSGAFSRFMGKLFVGLLALTLAFGVIARLVPGDGSPSRAPVVATATRILSVAKAAPSATAIPRLFRTLNTAAVPPGMVMEATDCSGYDAWEWAQSVYETDRAAYAGLDPDGDGIACNGLPHGFAPAFWTAALPANAIPGTIDYIVDGDTYEIVVGGQSARYRLYHADTPETYNTEQCGGRDATEFARFALSFSDTPNQVWIDSVDQRDKYGRKLAYLWFTVGGVPYLLNHVLINNGWAEDVDYGDAFNPYKAQLRAAAAFAREHRLGVWAECGGFGIALARPTPIPVAPTARPQQSSMNLAGNCDPNYIPCVPNVAYDLDCPDIGFRVQVIGYDRHRFDRDGDGIGCESY